MRPFTSLLSADASRMQIVTALAFAGLLWMPGRGAAQTTTPPANAAHAHPRTAGQSAAAAQDPELQKQIAELRVQVAKLQAALEQQQKSAPSPMAGTPAGPPQAPGRRMMGEMGAMPTGAGGMGEMGGMKAGGMGGGQPGGMAGGGMGMMDMDKGEMGMPPDGMKMPEGMMMSEMGMGGMSGAPDPASGGGTTGGASASGSGAMSGMKTGAASARSARVPRSMSSLPGVPGASHVYHVGSTGFFLDQPRLNLTTQQQEGLNRLKERALLEREDAERRIQQAEQELWALTGADQPDAAKVQAKLKEIEQIRTNQRIGFISAVGDAARLLTPEQQGALLGTTARTK